MTPLTKKERKKKKERNKACGTSYCTSENSFLCVYVLMVKGFIYFFIIFNE